MSDSFSNSVPPIRIPEPDSEEDDNTWNVQLRQRYGSLFNSWLPLQQAQPQPPAPTRYRSPYECGPLTDHEKHQMILLNELKKRSFDQQVEATENAEENDVGDHQDADENDDGDHQDADEMREM